MHANTIRLFAIAVSVSCGMAAMAAMASEWSERTLIGRITVKLDKTVVITNKAKMWKNPDLCDKDTKIILPAPSGEEADSAYSEIYALLIGAHLTNREIRASLNGCALLGNQTFPTLDEVTVY